MNHKLFLSSAGLPAQTRNFFLDLLEKPPQKTSVAFIPTAANLDGNKWYVDAAHKELADLQFPVEVVDIEKFNRDLLKQRLNDFDVIYVNGGNTFYLLEKVRQSGFDKLIPDFLDSGKIYVGVSAGSILVGPNIELAGWDPNWDKNVNSLTDLGGLNLVSFAIAPHFTEKERQILENGQKRVHYEIIPITDKQAVKVTGNAFEIVGQGPQIKL